jgi:hypothetical protein
MSQPAPHPNPGSPPAAHFTYQVAAQSHLAVRRPVAVFFYPTEFTFRRQRHLHLASLAAPDPKRLPPDGARSAYTYVMTWTLASYGVASDEARSKIFTKLLAAVGRTKSFGGLESIFLSGFAHAHALGQTSAVHQAATLWREFGAPKRLGGGAKRSPVLDATHQRIYFITHASLVALAPGGSHAGLIDPSAGTDVIASVIAEGLFDVGTVADGPTCGQYARGIGSIVGAVAGGAAGAVAGATPSAGIGAIPGGIAGGLAGGSAGVAIGGALGDIICGWMAPSPGPAPGGGGGAGGAPMGSNEGDGTGQSSGAGPTQGEGPGEGENNQSNQSENNQSENNQSNQSENNQSNQSNQSNSGGDGDNSGDNDNSPGDGDNSGGMPDPDDPNGVPNPDDPRGSVAFIAGYAAVPAATFALVGAAWQFRDMPQLAADGTVAAYGFLQPAAGTGDRTQVAGTGYREGVETAGVAGSRIGSGAVIDVNAAKKAEGRP